MLGPPASAVLACDLYNKHVFEAKLLTPRSICYRCNKFASLSHAASQTHAVLSLRIPIANAGQPNL